MFKVSIYAQEGKWTTLVGNEKTAPISSYNACMYGTIPVAKRKWSSCPTAKDKGDRTSSLSGSLRDKAFSAKQTILGNALLLLLKAKPFELLTMQRTYNRQHSYPF